MAGATARWTVEALGFDPFDHCTVGPVRGGWRTAGRFALGRGGRKARGGGSPASLASVGRPGPLAIVLARGPDAGPFGLTSMRWTSVRETVWPLRVDPWALTIMF